MTEIVKELKNVLREIHLEIQKEGQVFGVKPIQPKYTNLMGACFYSGKTADQIEHAVKEGHLRVCLGLDGKRSYKYEDIDKYLESDKSKLN